jgi:hypothetical protein
MIGRLILFVACLVFSTPTVSYGQQQQPSMKLTPLSCRIDPNDPERVLVDVLGTMSLQLGTDDIAGNAMSCLLEISSIPGGAGAVTEALPKAFLIVMEENPQVFFAVMSKNPATFRAWLDELPEAFTWFKNPPCLLEPRRKQLISLLEHTKMQEPGLESLKEQVIQKLLSIRCRQVQ